MMEERRGRSGRDADTLPARRRETTQRATAQRRVTAQPHEGPRGFHLQTRQEQAPNPASRVTLSAERDALGMPRARLDWRLTELDRRSFRDFYEVFGREIGRAGVGRVQMRPWVLEKPDAPWPASLGGGWHHMGTTRMHRDPRQGVVDPNCRVHGIANLSVAGAAVFPTAGAANPTLTLVALTLRLSDQLKATLT
jgi:choline dehydrogenase-like flavoprotein